MSCLCECIWHISSHYASLQSTGAVLGVAHRDGRLFTVMPEANPCISYFFVSQVGSWQETKCRMATVGFSDDGSCCWSRVNVRGRPLFVAVTWWSLCWLSHVFINTFSFSCGHEQGLLRFQAGTCLLWRQRFSYLLQVSLRPLESLSWLVAVMQGGSCRSILNHTSVVGQFNHWKALTPLDRWRTCQ